MNKKVLVYYPPTRVFLREDRCQTPMKNHSTSSVRFPIDMAYIAAIIRDFGYEPQIKDFQNYNNQSKTEFITYLKKFNPDIVILCTTTPTIEEDMESLDIIKKFNNNIITIAKSAHFLFFDIDTLKKYQNLDIVIRGEFEGVISELFKNNLHNLKNIKGITYRDKKTNKILQNESKELIENLDVLPFPARDLLNNALYIRPDTCEMQTTIITNRGCPYNCIYCLANKIWGKSIRTRSVENIILEIKECYKKYKIKNFHFRSDLFTYNNEWVIELCKKIIALDFKIEWACNSRVDTIDSERLYWMKKAGCWLVGFGIESGSEQILQKIKKGITLEKIYTAIDLTRKYKIKSFGFFIVGFPWENMDTITATKKLLKQIKLDFLEIYAPYPFPGTELEKILKERNINIEKKVSYSKNCFDGFYLTGDEMNTIRKTILKKYYLSFKFIIRTLLSIKDFKILFRYFKEGSKRIF